ELHVSQRGVVVLFHADPVLFDLPLAFLVGAPLGTVVVSDNRMCRRIFRALRVARAVATKRIVGARRFRDLPITRVCTRDIARDVAPPIERMRGMVSSSRRRLRVRINPLSGGPTAF